MTKFLACIATLAIAVVLLDRFLPSDQMDTRVQSATVAATSGGEIIYWVPLTAGGIAACAVSEDTVRKLPADSEVIVTTSALLGRCTGVYPFAEPQSIDRQLFIENALRYRYRDVYANLDQLRADYPGFTPRIRIWGDDPWFMPASTRRYSVQLPKELVIVDPFGAAVAVRLCGHSEGDCEPVAPARAAHRATKTYTSSGVLAK